MTSLIEVQYMSLEAASPVECSIFAEHGENQLDSARHFLIRLSAIQMSADILGPATYCTCIFASFALHADLRGHVDLITCRVEKRKPRRYQMIQLTE